MQRLNQPFYQPFIYSFTRTICLILFKIFWRLQVKGEENLPTTGAFIVAANHRSLADPPLVGVSTHRIVHFLAKEELFKFRPFGWYINNLNAHPLRRASGDVRAFKLAAEILAAGEGLILFPEGRRSKTETFQPPKPGVGMLAALANYPVYPAYINNSYYLKEFKRITITFGKPLFYNDFNSYQGLAEAVMREIGKLRDN